MERIKFVAGKQAVDVTSSDGWNADLYEQQFLHSYGEDLVDLLGPFAGERILDVGCGTGELASRISESGAAVVGMDSSEEMIETARKRHPELDFVVGDARDFSFLESFDGVFSNAALHWIPQRDQPSLLESINTCLRKEGRFVAEMGGRGNVEEIRETVHEVLERHGKKGSSGWFFPSVAEYVSLLDRHGFDITYVNLFDRPTRIEGWEGLRNWLEVFGDGILPEMEESERKRVTDEIVEELRSSAYDAEDDVWVIDYRKLRFVAVKKS